MIAGAAASLLSFLLAAASPDVVLMRDGRRIEGKILEEGKDRLLVETPFGRAEVARSEVRSVERGPSPAEEFAARREKAKTGEDFFALGAFARSKGLSKEARAAFEEAARLEPAHEGANRALGRVLFEGKWLSPSERERLAGLREEESFRAKGLVPHEGRWVSPEEKEALERGLVLHDGKWLPLEEAMAAKGLVCREGRWIARATAEALAEAGAAAEATGAALATRASEHFLVAGPYEEAFLGEIAEGAERVFAWFDRDFGPGAAAEALRGAAGEIFLFEDPAAYAKALPHFAAGTTTVSPAWVEYAKGTNGFVLYEPRPISVAARLGRERATLVGHSLHHVAHFLLNRRGGNGRLLPPWYDEGFACLGEFAAIQGNTIFCRAPAASGGGYHRPRGGGEEGEPDPDRLAAGRWREELARARSLGALPRLEGVLRREISELTLREIVLSMAVVERCAEGGGLGALHAGLRRGMPPSPRRTLDPAPSRALHDAAFRAAAGAGIEEVEEEALRVPASAPASAPAPPPRKPAR